MKAVVNTESFKEALKTIQTVCKGPTVTECLITFGQEGIVVEGANMGAYVKQIVSGDVEAPGAFVTNVSYLIGLRMAGKETTLEGIRNRLRCVSGRAKYDVEVIQDTVRIESQRPLKTIEMVATAPAGLLANAMARTAFTPSLNAQLDVKLEIANDLLKLTVNDEFRAAFYKASLPNSASLKACLPISFLSAIVSRFKEGVIQIGASEDLFKIASPTLVAIHPTRDPKIDTNIEEFIQQLETSSDKLSEAALQTTEMSNAIDSASSIVSGTLGYEVRLEIDLRKDRTSKVHVKSSIGESECELSFESLTNDVQLVLGSKYLSEFLRLAKGQLQLDAHSSLILIKVVSPSESLTLIMPQIESGV